MLKDMYIGEIFGICADRIFASSIHFMCGMVMM